MVGWIWPRGCNLATPDLVGHSATQQAHVNYVGLHPLVALGLTAPSCLPLPVLTCLLPIDPSTQSAEGEHDGGARQAHICHLGSLHFVTFLCVINTHFQNCSSWMLFENGQMTRIRETYTHQTPPPTQVWGCVLPPIHATPKMDRGDGWASVAGGSLPPGCLLSVGKNPLASPLDSTVKLKPKMEYSKTNKQENIQTEDWGLGRKGEGLTAAKELH